MKRISKIFAYYAKKNLKDSMNFSERLKAGDYLSLESFLKFMIEFDLLKVLNLDDATKAFKHHSKYEKQIDIIAFVNLLKFLCEK